MTARWAPWAVLQLLAATSAVAPVTAVGASQPTEVLAVNMTQVANHLVALWATHSGCMNRLRGSMDPGVMLIYDDDDASLLSYLAATSHVAVQRVEDPWALFKTPGSAVCRALFLCDTRDSPLAINAALTLAAAHGGASAACTRNRSEVLAIKAAGFDVVDDLRWVYPPTVEGNNAVQAFVLSTAKSAAGANISTEFLGASTGVSKGLRLDSHGLDFFVSKRMLVFMLDSANVSGVVTDSDTTQAAVAARYSHMTTVFGGWETEVKDVAWLSERGLVFVNAGRHLSLLSLFVHAPSSVGVVGGGGATAVPPLPPQPQLPASALPDPHNASVKAFVAFSFTQGDAVGFNQVNVPGYLLAESSLRPGRRIAELFPFSYMEGTFDEVLQPPVARRNRNLTTSLQWATGKGWCYTNPSDLWEGGALQRWLRHSRSAMDDMGYLDIMTNDRTEGRLATVKRIASHMRPPPRAIVQSHPLFHGARPEPAPESEEATVLDGGVVVLSDPVTAPTLPTGDVDANATVARVVASAGRRRFFWVFLDHTATAAALERVIVSLPHDIVPLSLDALIRVVTANASGAVTAA